MSISKAQKENIVIRFGRKCKYMFTHTQKIT